MDRPKDSATVWQFELRLPRHAFSARDVARPGDIWRCLQEAAIEGSGRAGWPPWRYRAEGSAFVVGEMVVTHHREASYGEVVGAKTWISRFQRGVISVREVRLSGERGALASASQKWVHVDAKTLRPTRAPAALIEAFDPHESDDSVEWTRTGTEPIGPAWSFSFHPWFTSMDPLDHANHPVYVDWCDENVLRRLAAHDIWPADLVPVADRVSFKAGATAADEVHVRSCAVAERDDGALVFQHTIEDAEGKLFAKASTVRTLASEPERLAAAFLG